MANAIGLPRNELSRFIVRRLLLAIPVVWGVVTLLFVIFFMLPGDRVDAVIGGERVTSAETRARIEERLGLDQPLIVQYGRYWDRLFHGDFGESYITSRPVSSIMSDALPASARLTFWAVAIEIVIGIGAGVLSATRKTRFVDSLTTVSTALLLSVPVFVAGYVFQLAFGVYPFQHGWPEWARLPVQGIGPNTWWGVVPTGEQWRYLVLPATTLALVSTAVVARLTRSGVRSTMQSGHVRGARARGVAERTVLARHGLRNALVPVLTFIGLDIANLFGSAVITETVFNWPGVGSEIANALGRQDAPVILGLTVVLAVVYVVVNLIVDLGYRVLDPRLDETTT